jgi:hypothetical protein
MLIRFVIQDSSPDSTRRTGLLVASHWLRDYGAIPPEDHRRLVRTLLWFNESVPIPRILKSEENRRALSWFRSSATDAIARAWELVSIARENGMHVDVLRTSDPGIVLYEDPVQVVAKPRKGQGRWW